jgi:hypothetical protein
MNAPAIIIRLELEAPPRIYSDCATDGERARLLDWLVAHTDLCALVNAARKTATT